ncbi:hypothetical protein BY458DRAFT_532811 [Sporodiniella umbellata]|nr:hypothetical protein BY458DRAFT_532811 [Sporodiniella umbellata]
MTSAKKLEAVLRHAYLNELSPEQWIRPTKECLVNDNVRIELCELLLSSMFSVTRVSDPHLESYLTYAVNQQLFSIETFFLTLLKYGPTTVVRNPHQWAFLISLLPDLLERSTNASEMVTALQHNQTDPWVDILSDLLLLLSHIVAIGLYPETLPEHTPLTSAFSFQVDSQFSIASQPSFQEMDFLDHDSTQKIDERDQAEEKKQARHWIEAENTVTAAQIMTHLIEKGGMKRVFEVRNNMQKWLKDTTTYEPWFSCQNRLLSNKENASDILQNSHVQKLLVLIQRLADRDSERRMAVHMKYHELEDEGTARAMPSAGIMGFLYHLVQIRPSLDDEFILDHLVKLQTVKGSFDESFYLELWLTALTGLREAALNTSCQGSISEKSNESNSKGCNQMVATHRLLWKSLVLVKMNPIESSLKELKGFTGLLNACSQPACCADFYAPNSAQSSLVDKIAFGQVEEDEDDIMKMLNDMNYSTDFNSPRVINSVRSLCNNTIYTNIVSVCEQYGLVRPQIVAELLKTNDVMDLDDEYGDKSTPQSIVDENIDQRIESLKITVSLTELTELVYIGLMSSMHLKKVLDFMLDLIQEKAVEGDFYSVSKLYESISECPIDLILQLYHPSLLLTPLEKICNDWTSYNNTDFDMDGPKSDGQLDGASLFYNRFGKIWQVLESTIRRFKLYRDLDKIFQDSEGFTWRFFKQGRVVYELNEEPKETELWMSMLQGQTDLNHILETVSPQTLLALIPTLVHRLVLIGNTDFVIHFQHTCFEFVHSDLLRSLCEELLHGKADTALGCLQTYLKTPNPSVLGTLRSFMAYREQESAFMNKEGLEQNEYEIKQTLKLIDFNTQDTVQSDSCQLHPETVTTGITPDTLFEKTQMMFRYIVKSGRSMFMSDVDANINSLWNKSSASYTHVISHYLDMVLFETALEIGGGHWFVSMIVSEVLEAGKSGGAVRAAELGSCLISTPLSHSSNQHNNSNHLLRCLLQDVLPAFLEECAQQDMSYFQGQTLGVFTSDCLVLVQDQKHEYATQLGAYFFETLVIQGHDIPKKTHQKEDGFRFSDWSTTITESAIWRGFIKGLMSNPMIEEIWPNAFI